VAIGQSVFVVGGLRVAGRDEHRHARRPRRSLLVVDGRMTSALEEGAAIRDHLLAAFLFAAREVGFRASERKERRQGRTTCLEAGPVVAGRRNSSAR